MHEVASADPPERYLAVQLRGAGHVSRHVPAPSVLPTAPGLRHMPGHTPQLEVLVLRYYADLSEAQIAAAMGVSPAAVKSHAAQAMSSFSAELRRTER